MFTKVVETILYLKSHHVVPAICRFWITNLELEDARNYQNFQRQGQVPDQEFPNQHHLHPNRLHRFPILSARLISHLKLIKKIHNFLVHPQVFLC